MAKSFFKLTVRDVPVDHKVVLVRVDYNVPLDKKGAIRDDFRIQASLPTLRYLLDKGATVVILSHLGRPVGRDERYSLSPVAARLEQFLGKPVTFVEDCIGDTVAQAVKQASAGSVLLLENIRFYSGEEANDDAFAKAIAESTKARYYVQDGFGVVHRAHASTDAITRYIPSVAGLLLEKEYTTITEALEHPRHPFIAVLGGAKVSDKIPLIERFIEVADKIVIGGAMANTILAHQGVSVGQSRVESGQGAIIDRLLQAAKQKAADLILMPEDLAVGKAIDIAAIRRSVELSAVPTDAFALDIGDRSIEALARTVTDAGTVIWNGPLGYAELPEFAHSSARLALSLATQPKTTSIIGGGDTADFVRSWAGEDTSAFTHISTGGGAGLELMSGQRLPGVESLLNARK